MKIVFFSDPHLGVPRTANTTPASAAALQEAIYLRTVHPLHPFHLGGEFSSVVCLGDLFDRFSNPERIIGQGLYVAGMCDVVLSGNHDVVNQADKVGSLSLVHEALKDKSPCIFAEFGKPFVGVKEAPGAQLFCVPHVANQELFEQSLGMALDEAPRFPGPKFLLLHCNYNLNPEFATETSLNLLDEHVIELLTEFDYILMGHEHAPAEHHDGRLIVLGNVHPTGFGDISEKRIVIWTGGGFISETIWNPTLGYTEYDCSEIPAKTSANFVRITGKATAETMLDVTKAVSRMWEKSEDLYGVKVAVELPTIGPVDGQQAIQQLSQLPDLIRHELKSDPELLGLWDELVQEEAEA